MNMTKAKKRDELAKLIIEFAHFPIGDASAGQDLMMREKLQNYLIRINNGEIEPYYFRAVGQNRTISHQDVLAGTKDAKALELIGAAPIDMIEEGIIFSCITDMTGLPDDRFISLQSRVRDLLHGMLNVEAKVAGFWKHLEFNSTLSDEEFEKMDSSTLLETETKFLDSLPDREKNKLKTLPVNPVVINGIAIGPSVRSIYFSGDVMDIFPLSVALLLSSQKQATKILRCPESECEHRVFYRVRKQVYCSPECTWRAAQRRLRAGVPHRYKSHRWTADRLQRETAPAARKGKPKPAPSRSQKQKEKK